MVGKMKKIVVWLSTSSRVSSLQVSNQMHLWYSLPISTCWWWEVTSARGRRKESTQGAVATTEGNKESKVVYLKTQIQWILFHGKMENWDWTLRQAHTMKFLGCVRHETKVRERKGESGRNYPKRWTSWAKSLRAAVLRNNHLRKPHDKQVVPAKWRGIWPGNMHNVWARETQAQMKWRYWPRLGKV